MTTVKPNRRFFQQPPPNVQLIERGIAAVKAGEWESAAKDFEAVVRVEPKNVEALNWYGYVLLRQGKAEEAVTYLERALVLQPTNPDTHTNLGNALLLKSKRSTDDTRRAVSLFERAVQLAPDSADAHYNLGYALARTTQYARACVSYRRSLEIKPDNGVAWTNLGYALLPLGKEEEARNALRKGLTYAPQNPEAWVLLAGLELNRGDKAAATRALETARKLDPKNIKILTGLGRVYTAAREYPLAVETYTQAAELAEADAGTDTTPRYNLGVSLAQWGKLNDALTAFDTVLKRDAGHYDAQVNAGYVLFRQEKYPEAIERFKEAIKIDRNKPLAWTNLAAACEAEKNWSGAAFAWRRAIALEPQKYEYRFYMASDLLRLEQYADAITAYKEAAQMKPEAPEPLIELGRVYEIRAATEKERSTMLSWLVAAQTAYEDAVRRAPNSEEARANVLRLRSIVSTIKAGADTPDTGKTEKYTPPKPTAPVVPAPEKPITAQKSGSAMGFPL